jgi:hypothetical protein
MSSKFPFNILISILSLDIYITPNCTKFVEVEPERAQIVTETKYEYMHLLLIIFNNNKKLISTLKIYNAIFTEYVIISTKAFNYCSTDPLEHTLTHRSLHT